jgi:hypothetical protein
VALSEIATDRRAPTFQVSVSEIGRTAGVSYNTAAKALALIEATGFLSVKNNFIGDGSLKTSNSYTLIAHDASSCKFCLSIRKESSMPKLQILGEDTSEEIRREEEASLSIISDFLKSAIAQAQIEFPRRADLEAIAGKFAAHYAGQPKMLCYERLRDWVQSERNPKTKSTWQVFDDEPAGWREFWLSKYPLDEYPNRERYEEQPWGKIGDYGRKWIHTVLKEAAAKNGAA